MLYGARWKLILKLLASVLSAIMSAGEFSLQENRHILLLIFVFPKPFSLKNQAPL